MWLLLAHLITTDHANILPLNKTWLVLPSCRIIPHHTVHLAHFLIGKMNHTHRGGGGIHRHSKDHVQYDKSVVLSIAVVLKSVSYVMGICCVVHFL